MTQSPEPLEYLMPRDERPPASVPFARGVLIASLVPSIGGLLILAAFVATGAEGFAVVGLFWLTIGGVIAFATTVTAIVGGVGTFSRSGDVATCRRYFGGTILMGVVSVVVAAFCAGTGSYLLSNAPFSVKIENATAERVDIAILFADGPVAVGPIPPGQTVLLPARRHTLGGAIDMNVTAGGRTATTRAIEYLDEDDIGGGVPQYITITDKALPPNTAGTP